MRKWGKPNEGKIYDTHLIEGPKLLLEKFTNIFRRITYFKQLHINNWAKT